MVSFGIRHLLLSILSGTLWTASFPPGHFGVLAWVAFVPLFKCIEDLSKFDAFRGGLLAGLVHYVTLMYWIVFVMGHYGGLDFFISSGIFLLLSFYLSLYPALFSVLAGLRRSKNFQILFLSGLWILLEFLRAKLFSGFPWCLLGHSQVNYLRLIQIADLTGVYGISFLVMSLNGLAYYLILKRNLFLLKRSVRFETALILVLLFSVLVYGQSRLNGMEALQTNVKHLNVALIQGNIDQSVKWDSEYKEKTIETYEELTRSTYGFKPDLIVWPETAVPFFFQTDDPLSERLFNIARESKATIIFGCPAYERIDNSTVYFNRAYGIQFPDLKTDYYDKVHLVPFGEYVPFKRFLPFIDRLVQAAGDFRPGAEIRPLKVSEFSPGILICFELIFPEIARTHVKNGAEIIVNLTNDAWFGMTSAPYQHLSMAVFRAVENRRVLVRCANTGFSAFIDPYGRIMKKSELFMPDVLMQSLHLEDPSLSFYTKYGDIFIWIIFILISIDALLTIFFKREKRLLFFKEKHNESGIVNKN